MTHQDKPASRLAERGNYVATEIAKRVTRGEPSRGSPHATVAPRAMTRMKRRSPA